MSFVDLRSIESREIVPGCHARFVHSDSMTVAFWEIEAGAEIPKHSHPHEQIANLIDGRFELTVDGEARELTPGSVSVIPCNAAHSARAITACEIIDVFHPPRDDYR